MKKPAKTSPQVPEQPPGLDFLRLVRPQGVQRIVSVRMEDGTEQAVDDAYLRRYLHLRGISDAFPMYNAFEMEQYFSHVRKTRRATKSATNSANASSPKRPDVTKEQLEKLRDAYEYNTGRLRGWKKPACLELGITLKTLNDKMKD